MIDNDIHIGGRDEQQDACKNLENKSSKFLILGDGMGGHSGGQVASETLIAEAEYAYKKYKDTIPNPEEFFQSIIDGTISALVEYQKENPESDPHTTCVLALIQNNKLYVGHIGDSRMYLFTNKKFEKRSRDHSVVQMLFNEGEITEEEMATHPDQNKLLKSISTRKKVKVTFKEYELPAEKSNAVLICSDGFWEQVSTDEMQNQLFKRPLEKALKTMVNEAKVRGGEEGDNISVVAYVQKGSVLSLFHNISKLQNILIRVIISLLILGGTIYYFKSTAALVPTPTKENNATQTEEVKKPIAPIASIEADSNTSLNLNNKDTNTENMDLNSNKIINTLPNKDENGTEIKSLQEEKNDIDLDKNGSILETLGIPDIPKIPDLPNIVKKYIFLIFIIS